MKLGPSDNTGHRLDNAQPTQHRCEVLGRQRWLRRIAFLVPAPVSPPLTRSLDASDRNLSQTLRCGIHGVCNEPAGAQPTESRRLACRTRLGVARTNAVRLVGTPRELSQRNRARPPPRSELVLPLMCTRHSFGRWVMCKIRPCRPAGS